MILNSDFMILNDGLCIEKNEKSPPKKILYLVFETWSILNVKNVAKFFFSSDFNEKKFGYDSDNFEKKKFLLLRKKNV